MPPIKKVAVFGASGNFGVPITAALVASGFDVTIVTRPESKGTFHPGVRVVRPEHGYTDAAELRAALAGHDAVVSALGPTAIAVQVGLVEAAAAAGVRRFVLDDFGWGPDYERGWPDLAHIKASRALAWDRAVALARESPATFSFTAVAIGNPIDWALKRFPPMGFDAAARKAIIYDAGTERFTGTTLEGIGQAVAGVLLRPDETANRVVRVRSVETCQNEMLAAFQDATASEGGNGDGGVKWEVRHEAVADVLERGRAKIRDGKPGWTLDLAVAQLFDVGEARCLLVSAEESDNALLGVREETVQEVVAKVLKL